MSNQNRLLVPGARNALNQLKNDVMQKKGFAVSPEEDVKYEVARELGIPLKKGYNGDLQAEDAGKIGGKIGGSMVREMIRMAQEKMDKK